MNSLKVNHLKLVEFTKKKFYKQTDVKDELRTLSIIAIIEDTWWLQAESLKEKTGIFKSPLWWSVCVLVGLLTLKSLTLDVVWLLYVNIQMNK